MADQYLIGVDIGTQGVKAGIFRLDGSCAAEGQEPSKLRRPGPGITEEDPDYQVESLCRVVSSCIARSSIDPSGVAAMAIDGQMAGVIGVGRDGSAVTYYDSWLDTRCAPYITRMNKEAGDEVTRKTGNPPSFNHGPKILWWKYERPEMFSRIARFVQPGGYAAMRLCGLSADDAFIDHTYLHFSGFADNRNSKWDEDLCRSFGVPAEKLPRIVEPERVIGELTSEMAAKCGLNKSVKVIAGCGDTAASFLACGATGEGICVDVAGTASVFAATTRDFRPDEANRTLGIGRSAVPGLWHPYAYINGGGMNLEWFRKDVAGFMHEEGFSLEELDEAVSRMDSDENSPFFIPHMAGRVSPGQPSLRGAFIGLDWTHTAAHMYRAVLEGVALEYGLYARILKELYGELELKQIRVTGGGQRSEPWNRIKSGVLGIPVLKLTSSAGAPMGTALLAGYGAGLIHSLSQKADEWIKTGGLVMERESRRDYYERRITRYGKLLNVMNNFMEDNG
jgi:xylulokinase